MIICHCNGVSDRKIREAVARGARSPREAALATGAARGCGGCVLAVRELVGEALADRAEPVPESAALAAAS